MNRPSELPALLAEHESGLLAPWLREQAGPGGGGTAGTASDHEARAQSRDFLALPRDAARAGGGPRRRPEAPPADD